MDDNNLQIYTVNVPNSGDCFFHALYRAAKEKGCLPILLDRFGFSDYTCLSSIQNETASIACMRRWLSVMATIPNNKSNKYYKFYYYINSVKDTETRKCILESQPSWLRDICSWNYPVELFLEACAEYIGSPHNWVSQHEVTTVKHYLSVKADPLIKLIIINDAHELRNISIDDFLDNNTLILYCRNEVHYNFISANPKHAGEELICRIRLRV